MTISNNVMKVSEWKGNSVWYKVGCSCTGDNCSTTMAFEFDEDFGDINITFYHNIMWADYWGQNNLFVRAWMRIKAACKILFTGYIELEGDFLIQEEEHLDDFIEALQEGKRKMVKFQKDKNNEN